MRLIRCPDFPYVGTSARASAECVARRRLSKAELFLLIAPPPPAAAPSSFKDFPPASETGRGLKVIKDLRTTNSQ